ncbi:uncharacterized protein LOC133788341 [Humulus lupulus]|uniref:uncharacterized protein LOC133788341 n=1 Tax=Humulus lupulus TaxID=3486 RepID=UPI002B40E03B|nr:uncharacterized protein LOC133788341 [Humulus lupulus]
MEDEHRMAKKMKIDHHENVGGGDELDQAEEEKVNEFFALIRSTREVRNLLRSNNGSHADINPISGVWNPTFRPEDFLDHDRESDHHKNKAMVMMMNPPPPPPSDPNFNPNSDGHDHGAVLEACKQSLSATLAGPELGIGPGPSKVRGAGEEEHVHGKEDGSHSGGGGTTTTADLDLKLSLRDVSARG